MSGMVPTTAFSILLEKQTVFPEEFWEKQYNDVKLGFSCVKMSCNLVYTYS